MKRVTVLLIDSLGVGAMPDAPAFGDQPDCNTLGNVAKANGGLNIPVLQSLGIGNIIPVEGVKKSNYPQASFGKMNEKSRGKDSTTGHWEVAGLVSEEGFSTYPKGFPEELMRKFMDATGNQGYYGNKPASGTAIIDEYHESHKETGWPIVYTSADSVFQIAADIDKVPIDKLYEWCEISRKLLDDGYNCSRVIARPYRETNKGLERVGGLRKDYSVPPPEGSILEMISNKGGRVIAIGKTEDIFVGKGITHSIHTSTNKEGLEKTIGVLNSQLSYQEIELSDKSNENPEFEMVFTNLVDTDMIYGHRRDYKGYGRALEEIDEWLSLICNSIGSEDLLIITADHGCDPTAPGTDHTREMVPVLIYNPTLKSEDLGTKPSFTFVARKIAEWLNLQPNPSWAH